MPRPYRLKQPHRDRIKRIARDKEYYRFYLNFLAKNGRSPTFKEFGENFGFSNQRAGQIMERLAKEGYLLKLRRWHSPYVPNIFSGYGAGKKIWLKKVEK